MKPFRAKLFALCGALAAVTSLNTHANAAGTVKGPANVLAGNILGVSGKVIVLAGIHVPFPAQACRRNTKPWACGLQSLRTLQQMAKGKPVTCRIVGKDAQSRLRGICRNANGELNTQMVRMGMALAAANAPAHLGKLQNIAKKSKRGLWSAEFIHPLEWRRGKRLAGMAAIHPELKGGVDDRVLVKSQNYPWRAIGRIDNGGRGYCSGVLISPTFVLTAGHCLFDKRTKKPYPPGVLHFTAGLQGDRFVAHSRAKRVHPSPYFAARAKSSNGLAPDDWGLLELAKPIGKKVGYIGWARVNKHNIRQFHRDDLRFIQAGYSQDRPRGMSAHFGCQFTGGVDTMHLAHHNCDAINGSSGSPIFYISRGQIRVVGVHSATLTTDEGQKIGGAILTGRFAEYLARHVMQSNGQYPPGLSAQDATKTIKSLARRTRSKKK